MLRLSATHAPREVFGLGRSGREALIFYGLDAVMIGISVLVVLIPIILVHKAEEVIVQAQARIHVALLPVTFPALQLGLRKAIGRGVKVVICTTDKLDLPGSRVVIASTPKESDGQVKERWLVLAADGESVLIGDPGFDLYI